MEFFSFYSTTNHRVLYCTAALLPRWPGSSQLSRADLQRNHQGAIREPQAARGPPQGRQALTDSCPSAQSLSHQTLTDRPARAVWSLGCALEGQEDLVLVYFSWSATCFWRSCAAWMSEEGLQRWGEEITREKGLGTESCAGCNLP